MDIQPVDTQRKRRRPAIEWQALISQWRDSGLSQKEFCQQRGLAISTFCKWLSRLSSLESEDSGFIELSSLPRGKDNSDDSPWLVELDMGSGIVLRIARES